MNRYANVYEMVIRLTDNPTLRAFYIPYLLCETDAERKMLNTRFWKAMEVLDETNRKQMREAMQQSFLQLLPMAKDLHQEVREAIAQPAALPA